MRRWRADDPGCRAGRRARDRSRFGGLAGPARTAEGPTGGPESFALRIAVTGGTGFVGRTSRPGLRAAGHEVVLLSRGPASSGFARRPAPARRARGLRRGCPLRRHQPRDRRRRRTTPCTSGAPRPSSRRPATPASAASACQLPPRPTRRPDGLPPIEVGRRGAIVREIAATFTVLKAGVIHGRGDHMLDHLSHALHTFPVFGLVGLRERPVRPVAVDDVARHPGGRGARRRRGWPTRRSPSLGPETMPLGDAVRRVARVDRARARSTSACPSPPISSLARVCRSDDAGPADRGRPGPHPGRGRRRAASPVAAAAAGRPHPGDAVQRRRDPRGSTGAGRVRTARPPLVARMTALRARRPTSTRRSSASSTSRAISTFTRVDGPHGRARGRRPDERSGRAGRHRHLAGPPFRALVVADEPASRPSSRRRRFEDVQDRGPFALVPPRAPVRAARRRGTRMRTGGSIGRRSGRSGGWPTAWSSAGTCAAARDAERGPQARGARRPVAVAVRSAATERPRAPTGPRRRPGGPRSTSVSHVAIRSVPARGAEFEDGLLAIEVHRALTGEGPARDAKSVVLIAASSAPRGRWAGPWPRSAAAGSLVWIRPSRSIDDRDEPHGAVDALTATGR